MKPLYITTTLPYVNGKAHVGHCIEFMRADMFARYARQQGRDVFFNTGLDEHGKKIYEKAQEQEMSPQEYVDEMARSWADFTRTIGMSHDSLTRTSAPQQQQGAQHLWQVAADRGYIHKKHYQAKYCVGCELEKTDSELQNGECPEHPGRTLETIDEENYFFAFSRFAHDLLDLYKTNPRLVSPDFRLQEITNFVAHGLQDFSVSRPKEKLPWGVPVPGDESQVMYVWFDALANYISVLGWAQGHNNYIKFWEEGETVQFCGKDNLRQQSAIWQAMLLAVGLPSTDRIFVEGHVISGGQKMSKSIGNVIDPLEYINYYGVDAVRYFVARHVHNFQDSDWTASRFHECYMANLVNGLGNLVNRVLNMANQYGVRLESGGSAQRGAADSSEVVMAPRVELSPSLYEFNYNEYTDEIWKLISQADQYITDEAPFKKAKEDLSAAREDLRYLLERLWEINERLAPIMPTTYGNIRVAIEENKKPSEPLFPRLEFNAEL